MTVPEHALSVALALARRIGAPPLSDDDARRAFFRQVAEQVAFERDGRDRVGVKARFRGAPQCTDCVAWFEGGALMSVDLQNGATGAIELVGITEVTGSEFIEVMPTDHLQRGTPAPAPAPPSPPTLPAEPSDLAMLLEDVDRIATALADIGVSLEQLVKIAGGGLKPGVLFRVK